MVAHRQALSSLAGTSGRNQSAAGVAEHERYIMNRRILRDANFRVIGYIDTDPSGKQTIKDGNFTDCGYFDPKTNETKDAASRVVGKGNFVAALLPALVSTRCMMRIGC